MHQERLLHVLDSAMSSHTTFFSRRIKPRANCSKSSQISSIYHRNLCQIMHRRLASERSPKPTFSLWVFMGFFLWEIMGFLRDDYGFPKTRFSQFVGFPRYFYGFLWVFDGLFMGFYGFFMKNLLFSPFWTNCGRIFQLKPPMVFCRHLWCLMWHG